ncbi:hypothetical protein, partial [Enterococcus faecium]|uniref:hypothetical protein n=1 Tax=Enterococcus faecium TaxID=1352 RepID=UPI0020744331
IHGKFLDANHWQYIFNSLFDSIYFYNKNDERKLPKSNISYIFNCCIKYYIIFSGNASNYKIYYGPTTI